MATTLYNEWKSIIIIFDAALDTSREFSASVTEHPIETGANIADHVTVSNPKFTIKGVVSDAAFLSPREQLESFANRLASGVTSAVAANKYGKKALDAIGIEVVPKESRSLSALQDLQFLYRERQFVSVQFGDEPPYNNCVITSIKVPKDSNLGDAYIFDISLEQVRVVSSRYTTVTAKRVAKPEEENLTDKKAKAKAAEKASTSGGGFSISQEDIEKAKTEVTKATDVAKDAATATKTVTTGSKSFIGSIFR